MRPIIQSAKLQHVRYDVRGPILVEAQRLEAEGHRILKLNIGNPAPFGFEAPEAILQDMIHNLPNAQGYSDGRGIYSARTAVANYYQSRGLTQTDVEDVYIGNGVSELISMVLQAFVRLPSSSARLRSKSGPPCGSKKVLSANRVSGSSTAMSRATKGAMPPSSMSS